MRTLSFVGLLGLLIIGLLAAPIQARWESALDNQSSTALAAMSNQQLFDEAFDVCVRRALLGSIPSATDETRQGLAECNDYLTTLFPVVRERNGGSVPPWMNEIVAARTTGECQAAFRLFLSKGQKPGKRAAAAGSQSPTAMPQATSGLPLPTAIPEGMPALPPPTAMPSATLVPPRPTTVPKATPVPPQPTAVPKATPVPPQPTAVPKATPVPPQPTTVPRATAVPPRPTAMPKGTPAQPRSGWSEQLPPWLAPR